MRRDDYDGSWGGSLGRRGSELKGPPNGFLWIDGDGWEYKNPGRKKRLVLEAGPWLVAVDEFEQLTCPQEQSCVPLLMGRTKADRAGLAMTKRTKADHAGLHRSFARLADKSDKRRQADILKLANRYGFLERNPERLVRRSGSPRFLHGESFATWNDAILEMAAAIALWDHVRRQDAQTLEPFFDWSNPDDARIRVEYRDKQLHALDEPKSETWTHRFGGIDAELDRQNHDTHAVAGGNAIEAARQAVYTLVEHRLEGQVAPLLSPQPSSHFPYRPLSLRATLYLHFLQEIAGQERQPIQCANPSCGRYFIPTHGRQRHCSDQCRKLASYYRRTRPST
jgi:hypothetical protein